MSLTAIRRNDAFETPEWSDLDCAYCVLESRATGEFRSLIELLHAVRNQVGDPATSLLAGEIDWYDGAKNRTLRLPRSSSQAHEPIPQLMLLSPAFAYDSSLERLNQIELRDEETNRNRARIEELRRLIADHQEELARTTAPESLSIGEIQRRLRDLEASHRTHLLTRNLQRTREINELKQRIETIERRIQTLRGELRGLNSVEHRAIAVPRTIGALPNERDQTLEIDAEIDRLREELAHAQRRIAELRRVGVSLREQDSREYLRSADARAAAIETALRSIDRGEGCAHCEMLRLRDRLQTEAADLRRDLQRICASIGDSERNSIQREADAELREKLDWEKRLQDMLLAAQERRKRLTQIAPRSIANLATALGPHGPGCLCSETHDTAGLERESRIRRLQADEQTANEELTSLRRALLRAEEEATPDFGNDEEITHWTRRLENVQRREAIERAIAEKQREADHLQASRPHYTLAEAIAGEIQKATQGRIRAMRRNSAGVWDFETKINEFVPWERLDRCDRLLAAIAIHASLENAQSSTSRATWLIDASDLGEEQVRRLTQALPSYQRPDRQIMALTCGSANEAIFVQAGARRAARRTAAPRAKAFVPPAISPLPREIRPAADFIRSTPVNRGWDCEEFPGELGDREGYQRRSVVGFQRTARENRSGIESNRSSARTEFESHPAIVPLRTITPPSFTEPLRLHEQGPRVSEFAQPHAQRSFERTERDRAEAEQRERERLEREHVQRERRPLRERTIEPRDFTSGTGERRRERRERTSEARSTAVTERAKFYLELESPIVDAPSIGPKMAEKFEAIGVRTVREFLRGNAADLAVRLDAKRIGEAVILQWQRQTRFVVSIPELRGHDAQILTACDVQDARDLARRKPADLFRAVTAFCESNAGKRVIRDGNPPDAEEVEKWITAAAEARSVEAA